MNAPSLMENDDSFRTDAARYRSLTDSENIFFAGLDPTGRLCFANAAFCRLLGLTSEQLSGKPFAQYWHPEDAADQFDRMLRPPYRACGEGRVQAADGWRWLGWEGIAVRDDGGRVLEVALTAQDVSERRQAERRVADQAALLDESHDAIFARDRSGVIIYWNRGAEVLFGWSAAETVGRCVAEVFGPDHPVNGDDVEAGLENVGSWRGELEIRGGDARRLVVDSRQTVVRDKDGSLRAVVAINTDVTERRRLEGEMRRAQRLEGVATLATGIAHELNNLLTPLGLAVDLLPQIKDATARDALLESLRGNVARGADTIRQLMLFNKGAEGRRDLLRLGAVLEDAARVLRNALPDSIEVRTAFPPHLPSLRGDVAQLQETLLNLGLNARDAMPDGGTLSYEAEVEERGDRRYVVVAVRDTGIGMPPDVLERAFDPFYSTKGVGTGTGLGLSAARGVVTSHGGFVEVDSHLGEGATFRLYFPAEPDPKAMTAKAPGVDLTSGSGELILVVDDEPGIRQVASAILKSFGYRVVAAGDGREALSCFREHQDDVRAVVVDMMMPVMDGPETIRALRQLNRKLPVVATSGLEARPDAAADAFLQKPYTARTLLDALREVLKPTVH